MSIDTLLATFRAQFTYDPVVEQSAGLAPASSFLVCGMGGSAHPAALLGMVYPELDIVVHRNYGLPKLPAGNLEQRLIVCISFSGNTEEPIDAYREARQRKLPVAVIARGGELLKLALADGVPFVRIPGEGMQPRNGLGLTMRALLAIMQRPEMLRETDGLRAFQLADTERSTADALGSALVGRIPIIYASERNGYLGYIWKIKLNETAKVPAFYHVFPELNHNEMQGYFVTEATRALFGNLAFVFLWDDDDDDPRVIRRMTVTRDLYGEAGLSVHEVRLQRASRWEDVASALVTADIVVAHLAKIYGYDPERVEVVEEFKRRIA